GYETLNSNSSSLGTLCSFPTLRAWSTVALRPGLCFVGCLSGQSKRLQSFRLFTNHSGVGLIFHHRHRAVFCTLFLPDTCFGTGAGLVRSHCHVVSVFGEPADAVANCPPQACLPLSIFIDENLNPCEGADARNALAHPAK